MYSLFKFLSFISAINSEIDKIEELINDKESEIKIAAIRARKIIEELDEPQKSIMQLRDLEGYDYEYAHLV